MRGLFTLLLGLIYLPVFLVGVPGIYLYNALDDGPQLGTLAHECGLYDAALDGVERLADQDPRLRRLPEPVRDELFDVVRAAVPVEFLRDETVRLHVALHAWMARPIVPLDYRLDLVPIEDRAAAALAKKSALLAQVPDCEELQNLEEHGCLPPGLSARQRADMLVDLAFQDVPETIDLGERIERDAPDELAMIGSAVSLAATLELVAWILLIALPLIVLLINLNHPGRMLRRVGLLVLIPGVLTVVAAHLAEISVNLELYDQSGRLAQEQQDEAPLEFSEARLMAAGQRLTDRLFGGLLTLLYVLSGIALALVIVSAFIGPRRRAIEHKA